MPKLSELLKKIDTMLTAANKKVREDIESDEIPQLVYAAYDAWCALSKQARKDDLAKSLYELWESLPAYQDDDGMSDYISDVILSIKKQMLSKGNLFSNEVELAFKTPQSQRTKKNDLSDSDDEQDELAQLTGKLNLAKNLPVVLEAPNPHYKNCSLQHMRVKQHQASDQQGSYETIFAELIRTSKTGQIKSRSDLSSIHHQLRVTSNKQQNNQGNSVVVDFSFFIKATEPDGKELEVPINFTLDIPKFDRPNNTSNTDADCFNYSHLGIDKTDFLNLLKTLYWHGREVVGISQDDKHGPTPKFDGSSGDAQFIYHTEQVLVAYLCQPKAAMLMANRLIAEMRSKYPELAWGTTLKVHHMVLHIHSDKTPCGPCEFSLIGLQNTWEGDGQEVVGFLERFENVLTERSESFANSEPGSYFRFSFPGQNKNRVPEKRGIRLFTVYTADSHDGTHRKHPVATQPVTNTENKAEPTTIETKSKANANILWTTNFDGLLESALLKRTASDTSGRTTLLSGSNSTPETKRTESKIASSKEKELTHYNSGLGKVVDDIESQQSVSTCGNVPAQGEVTLAGITFSSPLQSSKTNNSQRTSSTQSSLTNTNLGATSSLSLSGSTNSSTTTTSKVANRPR